MLPRHFLALLVTARQACSMALPTPVPDRQNVRRASAEDAEPAGGFVSARLDDRLAFDPAAQALQRMSEHVRWSRDKALNRQTDSELPARQRGRMRLRVLPASGDLQPGLSLSAALRLYALARCAAV